MQSPERRVGGVKLPLRGNCWISAVDPQPSLTPDPVKHLRQNPWLEIVPVLTVARVESSPVIVM
jgi:hypothetical protein